jgi:hypothetical protein
MVLGVLLDTIYAFSQTLLACHLLVYRLYSRPCLWGCDPVKGINLSGLVHQPS